MSEVRRDGLGLLVGHRLCLGGLVVVRGRARVEVGLHTGGRGPEVRGRGVLVMRHGKP